jgi:DNA-binding MarR family transcriptional regulator
MARQLSDADYRRLLSFRSGLRRFLHWSAEQASSAGLTPTHHQLLLAIRGYRNPKGPTIGEVAEELLIRHHSAVELADRAEAAGLVRRRVDPEDQRVVHLELTPMGERRLAALAALHLEELSRLTPILSGLEPAGSER